MKAEEWKKRISFIDSFITVAPICFENHDGFYQDARSAAFYAMGRAIKEKKTVGIMLPGVYLTSAYTAITEAWFQKANVVVFAFYDKVSEVKTAWAERCVVRCITVDADEMSAHLDEIKDCCALNGPALINIIGVKIEDVPIDYSKWIDEIYKLENNTQVTCYNGIDSTKAKNILPRDKYGVISKYVGMSVAKYVGYLLCTSDCVLLDANVFRTRYANSNMKIIVLDDGRLAELDAEKWITSNGWQCEVIGAAEYSFVKWLAEQKQQSVLIVR